MIAVRQNRKQVTPPQEDYLKAIWTLSESRTVGEASTGDLASELKISAPAVSKMLKQMEEQGLVSYTPYYGVRLTEKGRRIALKVVRRHRLLERFLVETLGYDLNSVHNEAERLEHHISDEFTGRIDALLGYPRHCPHGSPIPTDEGALAGLVGEPLAEIASPARLRVERLDRADNDLLSYLCENGLLPGASLQLLKREPFGGDLTIEIEGRPASMRLSRQAAKSIIVSKEQV